MAAAFIITAVAIFGFVQFITLAKECTNPPPGIQKMFKGVDITRLDLLPLESIGNNGFNSPIIKFTCDKGKSWRSPSGQDYQLPDQIWHMTTLPGGWMSAETELIKSSQELKSSFGADVGVEANTGKYAFSASVSYTKMQNTVTNSSKYISAVGAFVSATSADMEPSGVLPLDDFAKAYVDNDIKGTYDSNPGAYERFIDTYGTHFFNRGNFGGYIRAIYQTRTDYFFSNTEGSVKTNAKASYMNAISVTAGVSKSTGTVDEKFSEASSQSIRYYGGNTNLLSDKGLSEWQPTVANDPWLWGGQLKPISDLILDQTKKQSMEKAVEQYLLRSYLDELERLISYAKTKTNDAVLNSLQTRIQDMKNLKVLVKNDVDALGSAIDEQIRLPYWFTTSTRLCFKWWGDNDASQCGGGVANDLCATPNKMTQFYRDDTDIRIGGCMMQWGLMSNGYPDWFNQVQVCFWWGAESDGCQCGKEKKDSDQTRCVNINQFTEAYKDDTDARLGGCFMAWKLTVPSSAPLWMRTSKLCFSWYPDVEGDECGPAPSRDMCAVANDWIPTYRDNTHDFGGGCRMSWGLKSEFV